MTTDELRLKIEMTRMLKTYAHTVRRGKRPEIAAVAAEREMQFAKELADLEGEAARNEQLELATNGDHNHDGEGDHRKAA